jgi:adenylosuccinate synthase
MRNPLFAPQGAHVLVDGQYGSTGKGVLAAWLARENSNYDRVGWKAVITSAGPNSGHTFYDENGQKHVLKQLPTFAVASHLLGNTIPVYLSAGAIIDPAILEAEARKYHGIPIWVHPNAAVISPEDKALEHSGSVAAVAGTRSGTGAALARKVLRDPDAVASAHLFGGLKNVNISMPAIDARNERYFIEVSQGFSLGIN